MWLCSKRSSFFPFMHCPLVANRKTQWYANDYFAIVISKWFFPLHSFNTPRTSFCQSFISLVHPFRSYSSFSKTQADTQKQCDPISSKFCYICLFLAGINQFLSHWTLRPSSATFSHNFTVTRFNQYDR